MRRKGAHHRKAAMRRMRNRCKRGSILPNSHDGTDRISSLPNDVLISIISRLTVREATATSVLSSRWRHLHHHLTRLDFPPFKPLGDSIYLLESEVRRFRNHVNTINRVMDSHVGGQAVKELKLYLTKLEGGGIKKWVEFALTKEIETLEITFCMVPFVWYFELRTCHYRLGLSRLILTKSKTCSQPLCAVRCLKRLTLVGVDLIDQDFDLLVNNFLSLETLCIHYPGDRLRKVSIVGHLNLKHIDMYINGSKLRSLEIRSVMSLVSLRCNTIVKECAVELENVPQLTELQMNEHGRLTRPYDELFAKIPCYIRDQLELLSLSSSRVWGERPPHEIQAFQFVNVKHLELKVDPLHDLKCSYRFRPLIDACSSLEKAKIKFEWPLHNVRRIVKGLSEKKVEEYDPHHKKLSPNLKVLELEGYLGYEAEFELSSYVINYAVNLERLIVVACAATRRIRRKASQRASSDFQLVTPPSLDLKIM